MPEVTLPPEELEPEIPEEQLPKIEKPTELSKVIRVKFNPLDTGMKSTANTRQSFYTTDTDAWITFEIEKMDNPIGEYSLVLYNKSDGSVFQRTGDIVSGAAYYKIEEEEIKHAGDWVGQVVITLANGKTTTSRFSFNVAGHLLDGKDVRQIVIQDFETLMKQLNGLKDDAEIDFRTLKNDIEESQRFAEQNELERVTSENERKQAELQREETYDSKVDAAIVEADVVTKVDDKVAELSPTIQNVTAQLAQTVEEVNRATSELTEDSEVILARGGKTTLGDRLNKMDNIISRSDVDYSPSYDIVYENGMRSLPDKTSAYNLKTNSGHQWINDTSSGQTATLEYSSGGYLRFLSSSRNGFSPILINDFIEKNPYLEVRVVNEAVDYDQRFYFLKYIDKDNWIALKSQNTANTIEIASRIKSVETVIATKTTASADRTQFYYKNTTIFRLEYLTTHTNAAPSGSLIRVYVNGEKILDVPISLELGTIFNQPTKVGINGSSPTRLLSFKAGRLTL